MATKKVLIIEDERPIATALKLKLQHEKFDVDVAYDGEEGIKKLSQNTYDIAILDLIMPKQDGFQVLEEIKKKGITTPVIVASNLSQDQDAKKAKELGAHDFFIKSNISIGELANQIKSILNKQ